MGKKIIFAVDDAETTLSIIENALGERFTVVTIDTMTKMFAHLKKLKPDLILLDYYMPDSTCQEAMKRMKTDDEYKDIPVIIMSASNYPELMDEIDAMGALGFISKPIQNEELFAQVDKGIK
jgi:PleD family two-component response regulator